jgi:hypothetical protein
MSVNQKSGHGTLVAVQLTPGGAFTTVAEQGDINLPEFSRNEFDATVQNENIDSYILGVLRRGSWTIPLNWIPDNNTHDHLTGVYALMFANTMTGWRVTFPQVTPALVWVMSGQVQSLSPAAPVDGKLSSNMALRLSGLMSIGGVVVGS